MKKSNLRPGKMYASYVSRQLSEAGFQKSSGMSSIDGFDPYQPGFVVEEAGTYSIVFEKTLGKRDSDKILSRLLEYKRALENLGHIEATLFTDTMSIEAFLIVAYRKESPSEPAGA